jgi:Fur family ferric uptake transcriptional regulator
VTHTHDVPAVDAPDVEAAISALRAGGLRVSAARRLVLEAFYRADGPLSAEQVASGLDGRVPSSDLASVYRNLETLEALGLLRHFHLGHGPGMYALAGPAAREYLVCERCHGAQAVDPTALDRARAAIKRHTGWRASFSHFPVAGLCPSCAERGEAA